MNNNRILLRTSYRVAAIADFFIAFFALIPERMGVDGFVYPMGLNDAVSDYVDVAASTACCASIPKRDSQPSFFPT